MVQELTFLASLVIRGVGQLPRKQLPTDSVDGDQHLIPQSAGEFDLHTPSRPSVPDAAPRDVSAKHLFQAKRLRTELEVRGHAVSHAGFVLHRPDRIAVNLDHIGAPGQSQQFRPQRNTAQDSAASFRTVPASIYTPVRMNAPDGVGVVGPDTVTVNQSALTWTVDEVFYRGDWDDGIGRHRLCAPMALVLSACPLL